MADEDKRTVWCGNLSENVTEEILYELFLQAGPLQRVRIPKSRDGKQRAFGFVTYKHESSVPYAMALFEGTELFKREINLQSRNTERIKMNLQQIPPSGRDGFHNRSQSLPTRFSGSFNGSQSPMNFDTLVLLGQNLMKGASHLLTNNYGSQSGAGNYLGGSNNNNEGLSHRSLQGNWSNRNHPYSHNSGNHSNTPYSHNTGNHSNTPYSHNSGNHSKHRGDRHYHRR